MASFFIIAQIPLNILSKNTRQCICAKNDISLYLGRADMNTKKFYNLRKLFKTNEFVRYYYVVKITL